MSDNPQTPRGDDPEALLDELDSLKALLDTPEPAPLDEAVEVELPLELETLEVDAASAEAEIPTLEEAVPTLDEAVPVLDEAVPVLELVDVESAPATAAIPPREELEALIDILIERRLPAMREQLRTELLADLGLGDK